MKPLNTITYSVITAIAFMFWILIARLTSGNFLNSFPFISQDGFDWLFEGKYLETALSGRSLSELPLPYALRQPIFVGVTTVDAVFWSRGIIVIGSLAISFFLTMLFIFWTLRLLRVSTRIALWGIIVFVFNPLAYYRFWVLSDQIAIMFMHLSTLLLLKSNEGSNRKWLIQGTVAAILGGWTQVYALIPYGLGILIFILSKRTKSVLWDTTLFYAAAAASAVWATFLFYWYRAIPHETYINHLTLVGLNLNMAYFYINTWTFAFMPFLPVAACAVIKYRRNREIISSPNEALVVAIVVCFAILTLFFQWPEARYTLLYLGYVIILSCLFVQKIPSQRAKGVVCAGSLLLTLFVSLLLVPGNYWQPKLMKTQFDIKRTWLAQVIQARPVDRFELIKGCSGRVEFCAAADATAAVTPLGAYPLRVTADYRALMLLGK